MNQYDSRTEKKKPGKIEYSESWAGIYLILSVYFSHQIAQKRHGEAAVIFKIKDWVLPWLSEM